MTIAVEGGRQLAKVPGLVVRARQVLEGRGDRLPPALERGGELLVDRPSDLQSGKAKSRREAAAQNKSDEDDDAGAE